MIHKIYSTLPTFKCLEFRPGFNVLLARRHEQATDLNTRNRAGKSSFVQIVHFLLGGGANPDSIFRKPKLNEHLFGMVFDLGDSKVTAERRGQKPGRTAIVEGVSPDWPVQPSSASHVGRSLTLEDWKAVLGKMWFKLSNGDGTKYRPTVRSLISYFARREADDGMRKPEAQSNKQQLWDQQSAITFLLGLDWTIARDWQVVRDRESSLAELRRAAREGAFVEVISTSAQLRTQLVVAEQAARRVHETLERFEVLPEYRNLEIEASKLTQELSALANGNAMDEEAIDTIQTALQDEVQAEHSDLERIYNEVGVVLPESVRQRFEDVERFHVSVISNRKNYLETELHQAQARLNQRRQRMSVADRRRGEIMRLLKSHGALDQFQQLQIESARVNARVESLRQQFDMAQQLEGVKTELELQRNLLLGRLRINLSEQESLVNEAIVIFEEISESLYEDAGSLTLISGENGLKVEIQIQGDRSRGIKNMQVFCFDMMILKLCARRGIGPKFLIHDSHLFDGVDERQVAKALRIGAKLAEDVGWQYIVTLNEDAIPPSLSDFISDRSLNVRLTDEREDGGLFGTRF